MPINDNIYYSILYSLLFGSYYNNTQNAIDPEADLQDQFGKGIDKEGAHNPTVSAGQQ